jgi:hypothetical protein
LLENRDLQKESARKLNKRIRKINKEGLKRDKRPRQKYFEKRITRQIPGSQPHFAIRTFIKCKNRFPVESKNHSAQQRERMRFGKVTNSARFAGFDSAKENCSTVKMIKNNSKDSTKLKVLASEFVGE